MKTVKQIENYIEKQDWKDLFEENILSCWNEDLKTFFKEHSIGKDLLLKAFVWGKTSQGYVFWSKIASDYNSWFNK